MNVSKPKNNPSDAALPGNDNVAAIKPRKGGKVTKFDYQVLPEENRKEVQAHTRTIKKIVGRLLPDAVDVGVELLHVKELLPHGSFRPWLRREFRWSERTASNYMELARNFERKTAKFADLDLGTARALVAESTPAEIRNELFEAADNGESIGREEVRKRIADSKAAARKPVPQEKKADPSDAEKIKTTPAAGKSSMANGLRDLLRFAERLRLDCNPDEVAVLFLKGGDEHIPPNIRECVDFVLGVFAEIAAQMPPGSDIKSEFELAS
jgi:hypothetical protein